jgi:hypothetical protein
MTKQQALKLIDYMERLSHKHEGGCRDDMVLAAFRKTIGKLRSSVEFAHFEMSGVLCDAQRYYSDTGWQYCPGGLDAARGLLHHSLTSLRLQLETRTGAPHWQEN